MTDDNGNREVYLLAFSGMFYHPRLGGVVTGHIVESPQTAAVHYRGVAYQVLTPGGESRGETHRGVFIEDEVDPPVQETADMYREIFERGNARIEQAHHNLN